MPHKKILIGMNFVVAFVVLGTIQAGAQGYGQVVVTEDVQCCGMPDTSQYCGVGSGDPFSFCYEGYGVCCGVDFGTANARPDFHCYPLGRNRFPSSTVYARSYVARLCDTGKAGAREPIVVVG